MNTTLKPKPHVTPSKSAQVSQKPEAKPENEKSDWLLSSGFHWKYPGEMHMWRVIRSTSVMGLVLAVPTALGMATGLWIDTLWPASHSWFSILGPVGFILGCVCAIFWSYVEHNQTLS